MSTWKSLKVLWTDEQPSFSGRFASFPELYCRPKPVRPEGIPLWFGGHTPAMWDRAARRGAGLAAGSVNPERAAQLIGEVRRRAETAGRDPAEVGLLVMANAPTGAQLVALPKAHRQAGVTEAVVGVRGRTPDELTESVRTIAAVAAEVDGQAGNLD
jgi:alkanesulfonate monooxygenase SsuD/methylene tetrahydromethanopterin reductase-like flavin-dependent oxidoreductase (luciferase family)